MNNKKIFDVDLNENEETSDLMTEELSNGKGDDE